MVAVKFPNFEEIVRSALAFVCADGKGRGNLYSLHGESLIKEMRLRMFLYNIPKNVRLAITPVLKLLKEERGLYFRDWTAGLHRDQFLYLISLKEELERNVHVFFRENNLDGIISPATALPALFHGTSGELALNACY